MQRRLLVVFVASACGLLPAPARAQQPADVANALAAVRDQAAGGHAVAQFTLGSVLYYGDTNLEQAVTWFRAAASQRYAPAEYQLGQLYDFGFGVDQDDAEALAWYRRAAARAYPPAQRAVADFYRTGRGVAVDTAEAVRWYSSAARADDLRAQYQLGQMYFDGSGVARDYESAYVWFDVAASQTPLIDNRKALIELRNIAEVRMSPDELERATRRVASWTATRWP